MPLPLFYGRSTCANRDAEGGEALDAEGGALDAEGEALCASLSHEIARKKALLAGRCAYCQVPLPGEDVCGACGAPAGERATS
jgi:hypothetical protein